jgi:hypothetical protein
MARWTIKWLKSIEPEERLIWSARLFWSSIVLGILSIVFLCNTGFERVLMAISWGAITVTCVDIVATTDVRNEENK